MRAEIDIRIAAVVAAAILLMIVALLYFFYRAPAPGSEPHNFDECSRMYNVREGTPRTCRAGLFGETFYDYQGNQLAKEDFVRITNLPPAAVIDASPLKISGEVRRAWLSPEGTFPVELQANGKSIGRGTAKAAGDLTSEAFIPFDATIDFTVPAPGSQGAILLKKGSGKEDTLLVPIVY